MAILLFLIINALTLGILMGIAIARHREKIQEKKNIVTVTASKNTTISTHKKIENTHQNNYNPLKALMFAADSLPTAYTYKHIKNNIGNGFLQDKNAIVSHFTEIKKDIAKSYVNATAAHH
jgi:hypothetical protein